MYILKKIYHYLSNKYGYVESVDMEGNPISAVYEKRPLNDRENGYIIKGRFVDILSVPESIKKGLVYYYCNPAIHKNEGIIVLVSGKYKFITKEVFKDAPKGYKERFECPGIFKIKFRTLK